VDDARLVSQLVRLERRTSRRGKDSVDHPPGSRDDVANAAAGVLVLVKCAMQDILDNPMEAYGEFPHNDPG